MRTLVLSDVCGQAECWDWGGPAGYWDSEREPILDRDFKRFLRLPDLSRLTTLDLWFDLTLPQAELAASSATLDPAMRLVLHRCEPSEARGQVEQILRRRFQGPIEWK